VDRRPRRPGDVVITGDVPLAARCVATGARVLKHNGEALTAGQYRRAAGHARSDDGSARGEPLPAGRGKGLYKGRPLPLSGIAGTRGARGDQDRTTGMTTPEAVIFDIGNVLIEWQPERFYDRAIGEDRRRRLFAEVDLHTMNDKVDRPPLHRNDLCHRRRLPDWRAEIRMWHDHWLELASP
jgi:hypothetical protein